MHGRVKVRTTAEQEKIKQIERQKKAAEFKKGIELVFQKRRNREWDDELLLVTEKLLVKHPDVYTLWNIRREAFVNNNWSDEESIQKLEKELILTESSLRENPKSYFVWHQRVWILEQLPNPNWKRELELCNKCLNLDERNFHCWTYRQFIVNKTNISDLEDLEFTTSKILNNFSNYSSWHYRSKLLTKLYPSCAHDLPIEADKHNEELDLVMNATFTDPNDSSAWFYQRWLLDYWKAPLQLWQAFLHSERIVVAFHKEVATTFELYLNDTNFKCNWKSANGKKFSFVWYALFEKPLCDNYENIMIKYDQNLYKFKPSILPNEWIYKNDILNVTHNSKLNEQLKNYQTLLEMEPNNKWAKLTSIYLMLNIDPIKYNSSIMKELNGLLQVDSLRINYYKDLRSQCALKYQLNTIEHQSNENELARVINLSNIELTTLSSQQPYLTFFQEINFSDNYLGTQLHQIYILQNCIKLDLSNNRITSLRTFPTLQNLQVLLLSNNQITNSEEVFDLIKRHNLIQLNLQGNPLLNMDALCMEIEKKFPDIQVVA